ncbi:MAG: hypothetical protein ABIQ47_16925 [Tepidiformaceae bacterium]
MTLGLVMLLAALFAANGVGWTPPAAHACSCGPDCESAVHDADLIVEGRIIGWQRSDAYDSPTTYLPITLDMRVARVFKGAVPATLRLVDQASLYSARQDREPTGWAGSGGACGSFDEDPTGLWVIAAVYHDELGNYRMNRITTVFLSAQPGGDWYDIIVAKLAANVGPPVAGSGPAPVPAGNQSARLRTAGVAVLALGAGLALLCVRRRRWRLG